MSLNVGPGPFWSWKPRLNARRILKSVSGRRALRMESLESRYALSTTLGFEECAAGSAEIAHDETPAITDTETVGELEENVAGPIEADTYYATIGSESTSGWTAAPEGEASGAPVIDRFEVTHSSMYLYVTGHVTDDNIPQGGFVVRFGGVLEGHQTSVMPDGTFYFYRTLAPGTTGMVSAVAIDETGLVSPVVSQMIG